MVKLELFISVFLPGVPLSSGVPVLLLNKPNLDPNNAFDDCKHEHSTLNH